MLESNPGGLSLSWSPIVASLALTSSMDFAPKLRMSSRSASLRPTSSPRTVDALALEAVVRPYGEVELLDQQRQVGRQRGVGRRRTHVDALGLDVELHEARPNGSTSVLPALAIASRGSGEPLVSTSTISRSKSVRCSTRVASTL